MFASFWAAIGSNGRPWVAKVIGLCPVYGFKREFVNAVTIDHTHTRYKRRKLGARFYYALPDGLYDVYAPDENPWRYCIQVHQGDWDYISREEVIACLKNVTSE